MKLRRIPGAMPAAVIAVSLCLLPAPGRAQDEPAAKVTVSDSLRTGSGSDTVEVGIRSHRTAAGTADTALANPDSAGEVGSIPAAETLSLQRRKKSKPFSAAGFGPAGFQNVDNHSPAYNLYLGRLWEVNRFAAIKALGEVATDFDRATLADMTLGANLYASPQDFSPYVGAGLGFGYGAEPGNRDFGFNLGAQIGALLFRTSSTQMNLEGSAAMILSDVRDGAPTLYAARLGVLF
jgi:hypothetical protein